MGLKRPEHKLYQPRALQETILGAASSIVTFGAVPQGYEELRLVISAVCTGTSAAMWFRLNGDAGLNYDYSRVGTVNGSSSPASNAAGYEAAFGVFGGGDPQCGVTELILPAASNNYPAAKMFLSRSWCTDSNATTGFHQFDYGGRWRSNAVISSITIGAYSSSFATGSRFQLYGLRGVRG